MSLLHFENVKAKNTTLIFVDSGVLDGIENKGALVEHLNTLHLSCFNVDLTANFPYAQDIVYVFSTSLLYPHESEHTIDFFSDEKSVSTINSMMIIVFQDDTKAELWSVCGSVSGRTRGMARLLIEASIEAFPRVEYWGLIVDYKNPYWNRALSLYTSMGFGNPENIELFDDEFLSLTYNQGDKEAVRHEAKTLRMEYYIKRGFDVYLVSIPYDELKILGTMAKRQRREYGGAIGVQEVQSIKKGKARMFETVGICDLIVGDIIVGERASVNTPTYFYTFHTHPDVATDNNNLIMNPPSAEDLTSVFSGSREGYVKHFVVESEGNGVWSCQLNPRTLEFVCGIPKKLYEELRDYIKDAFYTKIYNSYFKELKKFRDLQDFSSVLYEFETAKNQMINLYLADLSSFTWEGIYHPEIPDDMMSIPIFQIDYFDWGYIKKENGLEDWTFLFPCKIPIKLSSDLCLQFGFEYDQLKPIMDALDEIGLDECGKVKPNESFEKSSCHDSWKYVQLSHFLKYMSEKDKTPAEIAEVVREGRTPDGITKLLGE